MSDPTPASTAKPKTSKWVKIALGVSLSLNLLIIGLVAGASVGIKRNFGPSEDGPGLRTLGLGPFAFAISREDRDALRGRIDHGALREDGRVLHIALRDVQRALRADPFDRALAEDALSRSRAATTQMQGIGHGALLDQLEAMPLEARETVADRVAQAMRRSSGRGGPQDGDR